MNEIMYRTAKDETEKTSKPLIPDFLDFKVNLRNTFKLQKNCTICGTKNSKSNPIESYHIKAIHKAGGNRNKFSDIMRRMNRKTIIVCKCCHYIIHRGLYNGKKIRRIL